LGILSSHAVDCCALRVNRFLWRKRKSKNFSLWIATLLETAASQKKRRPEAVRLVG
jgi:hypothetical protein